MNLCINCENKTDINEHLLPHCKASQQDSVSLITGPYKSSLLSCDFIRNVVLQKNPLCPDFIPRRPWWKRLLGVN